MAVARPTGRNETLRIADDGRIMRNGSSSQNDQAWTNACIYILDKKVFNILNGDYNLEALLTDNLADDGQLMTYKHKGFWMPVETYRDRVNMENLWNAGVAPWLKGLQTKK